MESTKSVKQGVIILIIAGIMVATKPDQKAYVDYAYKRFETEIQKSFCQKSDISPSLRSACQLGSIVASMIFNPILKDFVSNTTISKDFVIIKVYTTDIPGFRTFNTVGIFNTFVTF